ncbi:hypothetical protein [Streptomyces sp. NPDC050504]|uniref:hypothetical protein n=1 Tax=Streptomyces sp. NPDC050504 TaxID=3365618 RepID=UPI0037BE1CB0
MTTELTIPAGADVERLVAALNAAHAIGIKFDLGPNPHIRWDSLTNRYAPAASLPRDEDSVTTWEGGHALVIEYGDCEFYGRCQCGRSFGMVPPNRFRGDVFGSAWERHVMTELPSD